MDILIFFLGIAGFIAFCASVLWMLERLASNYGGKRVSIISFFFAPLIIGYILVFLNYQILSIWQIIFYPFALPVILFGAFYLAAVILVPETICLPFLVIYDYFKSKNS